MYHHSVDRRRDWAAALAWCLQKLGNDARDVLWWPLLPVSAVPPERAFPSLEELLVLPLIAAGSGLLMRSWGR